MATMYSLFCCIFSLALFSVVCPRDRFLTGASRIYGGNLQLVTQEQRSRDHILEVAAAELGVSEKTGNNDGARVATYLAYTGMSSGHAWCAAFVSWVYGQAGLAMPRNAWSPALFPNKRSYKVHANDTEKIGRADLFGIYDQRLRRINHVGIVQRVNGHWLLTLEGNVNNCVASRRRHLVGIHIFSNWLKPLSL